MLPWSLLAHSPARGALPLAHRVALNVYPKPRPTGRGRGAPSKRATRQWARHGNAWNSGNQHITCLLEKAGAGRGRVPECEAARAAPCARRQAMARTGELREHGLGLLVARFRRPHLLALWRRSHRGLGLLAREKGAHRTAAFRWPNRSTPRGVLWGSYTSVWWLQKVWKPQLPPGGGSPEGGAHDTASRSSRASPASSLTMIRLKPGYPVTFKLVGTSEGNAPSSPYG